MSDMADGRALAGLLACSEAKRAIFIDFEGTAVDPATFLGAWCEGEWTVTLLERAFDSLVETGQPKGTLRTSEPLDAFQSLRSRAELEQRRIVAWSSRELNEITGTHGMDASEIEWWSEHLLNALPPAKKWAKRNGITVPEIKAPRGGRANRWSLSGFRKATDYGEVAKLFEPGSTASRIRSVRHQLQTRPDYRDLTPVAKRKWTNVLTHNFHDCAGLAHVVQTIACRETL